MRLNPWLSSLRRVSNPFGRGWASPSAQKRRSRLHSALLRLEFLEDRSLPSTSSAAALAAYGHLPLAFEQNQGQAKAGIDYLVHASGYNLDLSSQALVLAPSGTSAGASPLVTQELIGANPTKAIGLDELITKTNYLLGPRSQWHTNIPNFGQVEYQNVYPGIDLVYYGNQGRLEYEFLVAPGADTQAIRMAIVGGNGFTIDAAGDLVLHTSIGDVVEQAPAIYQTVNGVNEKISGRYLVYQPIGSATPEVGFQIGAYDHSRPLVIDPALLYSFSLPNAGFAVAVDSSGDAYVTGGAFGGPSGWVGKLNPSGTAFIYLTYLGAEFGGAIAIDSSGDVYVVGEPSSGFVTTSNAFSTTASTFFMSELNPTGSVLLYSTYIPGARPLNARGAWGMPCGVAVDSSGNVYVTGAANSSFITTSNAYQTTYPGAQYWDAFLAEFNPSLSGSASLVYSSFFGGRTSVTEGTGVALDGPGNVYITGVSEGGLPITPGAFQTSFTGFVFDSFVANFNTTLSGSASLVYSTYLGGSGGNNGIVPGGNWGGANALIPGPGIAVDSAGEAYVAGQTQASNFPTTSGAFQTTYGGSSPSNNGYNSSNAYVTKLNAAGSGLVYSTFLSGTILSGNAGLGALDAATSIAINSTGDVTVTGWTQSTNFPTQAPIQGSLEAAPSTFVTTLNPSGSALLFSTYLGGSTSEFGSGVALDSSGNIYVANNAGWSSGSINKISALGVSYSITGFPSPTTAGTSGSFTVTVLNPNGTTDTGYTGTISFTSSDPLASLPANYTFTTGTGGDNGVHVFTNGATLETAGSQSITGTDTSNSSITGSEGGISVTAAAASSL